MTGGGDGKKGYDPDRNTDFKGNKMKNSKGSNKMMLCDTGGMRREIKSILIGQPYVCECESWGEVNASQSTDRNAEFKRNLIRVLTSDKIGGWFV